MAASKERIVSSGRSHRERVGLERSGSAAGRQLNDRGTDGCKQLTNWNTVSVGVLKGAQTLQGRLLERGGDCT